MKRILGLLFVTLLALTLTASVRADRNSGGGGGVGVGGHDDDERDDGHGEAIVQIHTLAASPGSVLGSPASITFESLNTNCGGAPTTFSYYLNGSLIGTASGDPNYTCTCTAPITTFVVSDGAQLAALWLRGQDNSIAFVKSDPSSTNAYAWTRATIALGPTSERVCVGDYAGGNCTEPNLCNASYIFGNFSSSATTGVLFTNRHPIRGVDAAEGPRTLREVEGKLKVNGDLDVAVKGLVAAADGRNADATFKAIVSCITSNDTGQDVVVNLASDPATASNRGNAHIRSHLTLPQLCMAPVLFVTNDAGEWLAVSGY